MQNINQPQRRIFREVQNYRLFRQLAQVLDFGVIQSGNVMHGSIHRGGTDNVAADVFGDKV